MAAVAPKTNKGHDLGTSNLRWGTLYAGEVNLDGNLTVTGSVTTTVSQTLEIEDATIKVAKGNDADSVDFGMFGQYVEGGSTKYSVIFRDNSDSGKWKIWTGFTNEPPAAGNINIDADGSIATLVTRLETDQITGYGDNADISITPDGTGNLLVNAATLRVGDNGVNATITTNGSGNLTLNTNSGTNSGSIVIATGVNGNISITPNGSGEVDISKVDIDGGDISGTDITVGAGNTLNVSAGTLTTSAAQKAAIVAGVGADVDIGDNGLRAQNLTADSLTATRVVFAGADGLLSDDSDLTFDTDTLTATKIGAFEAAGAINFASQNMTNVNIDSGTIDGTDVTVGAGKTLNVSAGTLTTSAAQKAAIVQGVGQNIDIGTYDFRASRLIADQLTENRVVIAGSSGTLEGDGDLTFSGQTLTATKIGAFEAAGAINFANQNMTNVDIDSGTIEGTDITVGNEKTLDVSAGTLTTSAAQKAAIVAGVGANVDIGDNDLRAQNLTADSLTATRVVFAGANGLLSDDSDLTFSGDTLTATKIGAFEAAGAINFASQDMTNVDIDSGTIDGTDITVGAGNTLNVSAGTLTTSAAQNAAIVAGVGANVDIGDNDLRAQTLTADSLTATRVVFAGANGVLSDDSDLTFSGDTLTATKIGAFQAAGAINFADQAMTNVDIESGTIDGTAIGSNSRSSGKFTTLQANGDADFTSDVDISLDSGTAFRVGTTTNLLKSVFIVDTTDNASSVTVAGDLIVNDSITAGDTESGSLTIKGGLKYDIDTSKTASATLGTSEHVVVVDASGGTPIELTLPAASNSGQEYVIIRKGGDSNNANHLKIIPAGANVVYSAGTSYDTDTGITVSTGHTLRLISDGTHWYAV